MNEALEETETALREMLNEVQAAQDLKDPKLISRAVVKVQSKLVETAKEMPFPITQFH